MKRALGVLAILVALILSDGRVSAQNVDPIVSESTIDAPVDAVWAAWTTSEGLRAWLAPHAETELRLSNMWSWSLWNSASTP